MDSPTRALDPAARARKLRIASRLGSTAPYGLAVLSGASALILEVIWLKELGVLFGNTARAAAATLFVFFLGRAVGGHFWGRLCNRVERPLRLYGLLELGVGASALLFFGLVAVYRRIYDSVFDVLAPGPALAAKILLGSLVLFLPAFFMGGTLPALAQRATAGSDRLGRAGSRLYTLNTFGAAGGAFVAGFYLPSMLGIRGAYLVGVVASALAGVAGVLLDRFQPGATRATPPALAASRVQPRPGDRLPGQLVLSVAFLSGFLALGMEVLWTRLLAQVLDNSTYAFSAILVTYLVALGMGAFLSAVIADHPGRPVVRLYVTLALSGAALLASAAVFVDATRGLSSLALGADWPRYVRSVFLASGVLLLVPGLFMGIVLPFLFGVADTRGGSPGTVIGRLLALNSLGAISGALVTGFVVLDFVGYWGSLRLMAGAYLLLAALVLLRARSLPVAARAAGGGAVAIIAGIGIPGAQPLVKLGAGESLVDAIEGSGGTVTVVRSGDNLVMRLNNSYVLGDSRSADVERLQAHLPLLLHPDPQTVFFLGMGTGITAGAALDHPVSRVVVAELLPEVVAAARAHFSEAASGLFGDPRVRIVADDGRSFLAGKRDQYDLIISDLFTPWHAGSGSLYTAEHFRTVRDRLRPGGIFAQWLPLYQMSRREFLIIARTLQAVFPQVTIWRGNFSAEQPILALVARGADVPLEHTVLQKNAARLGEGALGYATGNDHMAGLFYAGNLSSVRAEIATLPINTDDRPIIEYLSPRLRTAAGRRFVGAELEAFLEHLFEAIPPARDPVLADFPERERGYVPAGLDFFRYYSHLARGQQDSAAAFLGRFRAVVGTDANGIRK